jgi:hypothetical protein
MTAGRWAFLTFGAGLPNWRGAANRLGSQARESGWFESSIVLTDRDLASRYPHFSKQHAAVLNLRTRGYGYWIWKSFLISEVWEGLRSRHDGIMYLDSGCEFNVKSRDARGRLGSYFDTAADLGLFAVHLPGHPEHEWSRVVTMDRLGLSQSDRSSPQVQGGILIATEGSMALVREWQSICVEQDYRFVKDPPRGEGSAAGFRSHRHDQSIFSGLVKQAGIPTIPDETFWAPDWAEAGASFPIWAPRNRTRVPIEAADARSRVIRFAEKSYSKAVLKGIGMLSSQ